MVKSGLFKPITPGLFERVRRKVGNAISGRPLPVQAGSGQPYDAGATGRRAQNWVASRLGPTTLLLGNQEQIRARSRDEIRNNPWAASAIDNFEANLIGAGIQPHWQHPDEQVRIQLQDAWERWNEEADYSGMLSFYALQALAAREIFEAGEVLMRFHIRPAKDRLFVPLQLQLIEGEQMPVFRTLAPSQAGANSIPLGNSVRTGIEFDPFGRRVAYHLYKEHPGETMFYPMEGLQFMRVPAVDMIHVFKALRAGQLRGQPAMTAVLGLLYELGQYTDAALVRQKISTMFAAFIEKPLDDSAPLPPDPAPAGSGHSGTAQTQDPGVENAKLEPGTMQVLYPGEKVTFPATPSTGDFAAFVSVQLHKFAAGLGMTYEQVSMDLQGVNYSSIRAGILEFRRRCEQFQYNVIIHQLCRPILRRWLKEAVLVGALDIPGYFSDPRPFEKVVWVPPGWQWVDPAKEMAAYQMAVRSGFTSRTMVVRETGYDPAMIDGQQADERARAAKLGLTYDSDPNKVLIGRETLPTIPTDAKPDAASEDDAQAEAWQLTHGPFGTTKEKVQ